jgi:hypothetical protein
LLKALLKEIIEMKFGSVSTISTEELRNGRQFIRNQFEGVLYARRTVSTRSSPFSVQIWGRGKDNSHLI